MSRLDCLIASIIFLGLCFLSQKKRDEFFRDVIKKTKGRRWSKMTNRWTEDDVAEKFAENSDLAVINQKINGSTLFGKKVEVDTRGHPLPRLARALEAQAKKVNKYHAQRTYSEVCHRVFASKAEAIRGEELAYSEKAGKITDLRYQVIFVLCVSPKVTIRLDFAYLENGQRVYEDVKGILTRDFRTKLAWLKEKYGVDVKLIR